MRKLLLPLLLAMSLPTGAAQPKEFTLENGLRVIVKEDHRAPVAVSMVWYDVGSADEPGGLTGVSHALEHLMFKGTPNFPLGVFSKTIAGIGGEENAFTNYDYTAYFEKLSAIQLPVALEMEADRMKHLLLDPKEFKHEMKVIREERRLRTDDNPQALAYERHMAAANLSAPYQHPVIGWMSDLYTMTVTDARAWYQNFYAPNHATLVVVGDVSPEKVLNLAKLYFGNLEPKPAFVRKPQREPKGLGKKRIDIEASAQVPLYLFGYTVPSLVSAKNPKDAYALEVIAGILGAGESARLSKNLIRSKQIASSADVYYNLLTRYQGQFMLFATPSQHASMDTLKAGMMSEIKRLQTEAVPSTELERVKNQIIAQKTFEKDSIFGQAMELGLVATLGLPLSTTEQYTKEIANIEPSDIQRVAKTYFENNRLTETYLFPASQAKQ